MKTEDLGLRFAQWRRSSQKKDIWFLQLIFLGKLLRNRKTPGHLHLFLIRKKELKICKQPFPSFEKKEQQKSPPLDGVLAEDNLLRLRFQGKILMRLLFIMEEIWQQPKKNWRQL